MAGQIGQALLGKLAMGKLAGQIGQALLRQIGHRQIGQAPLTSAGALEDGHEGWTGTLVPAIWGPRGILIAGSKWAGDQMRNA